MKQRPGDQRLPDKNERPYIQDLVIADIEARKQVGIERYGTLLQSHNGRDGLQDLYEELLDGAFYAKLCMEERETILKALGSALWVFNNLHNADTERWKTMAQAAAEDVQRAFDLLEPHAT